MMFETDSQQDLAKSVQILAEGYVDLPAFDSAYKGEDLGPVLQDLATRMQDNYPYAHPLYAGQMLKPPHPIARTAYSMAMQVNPNNHALDGGRASSELEKQAVARLAAMFGWQEHLGHLCGGGTMANLEALWIAGKETESAMVVASQQAHYTHSRISSVLGLPFQSVAIDRSGRMDIAALEVVLQSGSVGTVVVTLGTTGCGAVDPLDKILELQKRYDFRIHVDAAYGGYFCLASNLEAPATDAFSCISQADSIVIDPHKHGLQPYGCGSVLFKNPAVGRHYKHESPYTYFSSSELHLGEISLECSRPGAAAAALWATQTHLPMRPGGQFAQDLERSRSAAKGLYAKLSEHKDELILFPPELDIVVWAPRAASTSDISQLSKTAFDRCADKNLHLALLSLPSEWLVHFQPMVECDSEQVVCLRSCLMKPEHLTWLDTIWDIYCDVRSIN